MKPTIQRMSPQIAQVSTLSATMLDVIVALVPALLMGVYLFGLRVLLVTAVSVGTCVLSEYLYRRLRGMSNTIGDLSACVSGLLLAMSLPVTAPLWAPVLGGVFAMIVVKQFYGGIGRNFMNPALAGRVLLTTFPGLMTSWVDAFHHTNLSGQADALSSATPMALMHDGILPDLSLGQMLMGQHGGAMGAAPSLMLIAGGLYLIARRVISPRSPFAFLATVAVLTFLFPRGGNSNLSWMMCQLLNGGVLMGAFFMASDYATTPVTPRGQTLFGIGCGALTVLLRYYGSYPDGVGWAILTMNCCVWILDRLGTPRRFGMGRFAATRMKLQAMKASLSEIRFVKPEFRLFARAGAGTMPGEGYLDELQVKLKELVSYGGVLLAVAVMVFAVHRSTDYATVLAENEAQQALLSQVMPQATIRSETPYYDQRALSITAGYNESQLIGYCVEVQSHGFGGVITAVVGVNTNGEVTGVAITDHKETLNKGTLAMDSDYLAQYIGKSGTIRHEGSNSIDAISGATETCEAITDCVNQALAIVAGLDTSMDVPYTDGEV